MSTNIEDFKRLHLKGEDNPEQVEAFKWIIDGQDSFMIQPENTLIVIGEAGTGKSKFIQYVQSALNTITVSFTAKAALNVGGLTIHRFFNLPISVVKASSIKAKDWRGEYFDALTKAQLLIIDEVSMLRYDLLWGIDQRCKNALGNQLPFGGMKVVFFGDPMQLSPFVNAKAREAYHNSYKNKLWFFEYLNNTRVIQFAKQYRQKEDLEYAQLLGRLRVRKHTAQDLDLLNTRVKKATPEAVIMAHDNQQVEDYNKAMLAKIDEKEFNFKAKYYQDYPKNKDTQLKDKLSLKVGARVIATVNDDKQRWVNGSTGTVRQLDANYIGVEFDDGGWHKINKVMIEQMSYNSLNGSFNAFVSGSMSNYPLKLGWAVTIHKSQGQNIKNAHISLPYYKSEGLAYTALSRVSSLKDMTLEKPIRDKDIQPNEKALQWMNSI